MKITLTPTAMIERVQGVSCRVWTGTSESIEAGAAPIKAWIPVIQPQTHDEAILAGFEKALKEMPYQRELVSFDLRMAVD